MTRIDQPFTRLAWRAPGVLVDVPAPRPSLAAVRMDVCAFVGVAPRGPARAAGQRSIAAAVESFDDYRRRYGGFEGPSLLPFAVASFFQQGGQRAYVVRIVHEYANAAKNAAGLARGTVAGGIPSAGELVLLARNEGSWGNNLRAALGFSLSPIRFERHSDFEGLVYVERDLPVGSLLQLTLPGDAFLLRFVTASAPANPDEPGGSARRVILDDTLPAAPQAAAVVEGALWIDDGPERQERHQRLGLCRLHPRWMAAVLSHESSLVYPDPVWAEGEIRPASPAELPREPVLPDRDKPHFTGGLDRYHDITPADFFDEGWVPGNPDPGDGVHALVQLEDLSTVVVPDLYSPLARPEHADVVDRPPRVGATFVRCVDSPGPANDQSVVQPQLELAGLQLDPQIPGDLQQIVQWQQRLVNLAERLQTFVVLLDAPPRLGHRQLLRWRSAFRSSYAAAYHPWPIAADPATDRLVRINPSAVAAGIIARQEIQFGVPHGPANVVADGVVDVDEVVSSQRHDELHPLGLNVLLRDRDGVRLTAARTLSADRRYRQLSVRRLMLMLRRVLAQQMDWMVFEPNGPALWSEVRQMLQNYLRQLWLAGAFRGETEDQAFFVRCDASLNPPRVLDEGKLIAEVGVAPAEPIEFIVIRIAAGPDGAKLSEA